MKYQRIGSAQKAIIEVLRLHPAGVVGRWRLMAMAGIRACDTREGPRMNTMPLRELLRKKLVVEGEKSGPGGARRYTLAVET
jgi:hypothetical protein